MAPHLWHSFSVSNLELVGRSDDGNSLQLESSEGESYTLEINEQLRFLVNQPRLVAVSTNDERSTVTVKEIQARLRSGETIASISETTDWSAEKIEKFSGPILQERAYVIGLALAVQMRKEKHSPSLSAATIAQLAPRGVDMTLVEWNTWRLPDGTWNIILNYPTKDGGTSEANWCFDLVNRTLEALDDGAFWISGEEEEVRTPSPSHGIVYPSNTPAPRLVAVREGGEDLNSSDRRDGVTKRLKIPSWDDIMFGGAKETSEEE